MSYVQKRIMHGERVGHARWPWFVRLQYKYENVTLACGAFLMSDIHVLTAAHCFDGTNTNDMSHWNAYIGVVERNDKSKPSKIKEIILHEDYDEKGTENDIALLTLSQPVQFYESSHPVCLPSNRQHLRSGTQCWISGKTQNLTSVCLPSPSQNLFLETRCWILGFGKTHRSNVSEWLNEVPLKIIDQKKCNASEVHNGRIYSSMLCAGDLEGGPDACDGDSGGPLMCEGADGLWYLTGLISWGHGCGLPNKPGVYTNITHFSKWIHEKTEAL